MFDTTNEIEGNLHDIFLSIDKKAKNVAYITNSGDGWAKKLAWNPSEILNYNDIIGQTSLAKFIDKQNQNNNLVVGFISYDYGYELQGVTQTKKDNIRLPKLLFATYENYLSQEQNKIIIHSKDLNYVNQIKAILSNQKTVHQTLNPITFLPVETQELYNKSFEKIKNYIKNGHIYQANLTHRLEAKTNQNPRTIFYKLAKKNIAGMMSYFEGTDFELISMSPERFIRTEGNIIETFPIKGTRSKVQNSNKNMLTTKSLLDDKKELSELSMITDLLRNDMSKVCVAGSVLVEKSRELQTLSSVIHTFSKISGRLKHQITPIEALLSMFPGGSITGCPKKRAMEIIDELETNTRGAYCGCLLVITPDGNLDSSILIRTIIKKGTRLILPVGGGIVFDSVSDNEYQETLDKASSILTALN